MIDPAWSSGKPEGLGHECYQYWCEDRNLSLSEAFGREVFVDGSSFREGHKSMHTATWAVVAVNGAGDRIASLSGSVGRLSPKTPEHIGALAAIHNLPNVEVLWSDYANICGLETWGVERLCDPGSVYSGPRLLLKGHSHWSEGKSICKVQAHQDVSTLVPGSLEHLRALGNYHADLVAKAARGTLTVPSPNQYVDYESSATTLEAYLRYVAAAMPLFPSPAQTGRRRCLYRCRPPRLL